MDEIGKCAYWLERSKRHSWRNIHGTIRKVSLKVRNQIRDKFQTEVTAEDIVGGQISQDGRDRDDNGAEHRTLENLCILYPVVLSTLYWSTFQHIRASKNITSLSVSNTCTLVKSHQENKSHGDGLSSGSVRKVKETQNLGHPVQNIKSGKPLLRLYQGAQRRNNVLGAWCDLEPWRKDCPVGNLDKEHAWCQRDLTER